MRVKVALKGESGAEVEIYGAKRLRHALAFSRCSVMERRWRRKIALERSVWSSPIAKVLFLASSDQTPRAILPQPPPTASITIGMKVMPWA